MSFFSRIFQSSKTKTPADLSSLKTDIHSHFLPALDDGSKNMDETISMMREIEKMGYKKLICTPHIMSDYFKNSPETILPVLEKVKTAIAAEGINLELSAAAEYYVDFDFERKLKEEKLLTFGKNYLLFEISYLHPPENLNHVIFNMITQGYKPVMAHPERYNFWHSKFNMYEEMIEKGVLLQLNINSLTGYYSIETKRTAEKMIEKGMVSFIGTDCHHAGHISLLNKVVYEKSLHQLLQSGKLLNANL
jgi:tyrosine-protein phosphatase YwqE